MAKAKAPKDYVIEYFQDIRYFQEEDRIIVILPEGLKIQGSDLDGKHLKLDMAMDGIGTISFVANVDIPIEVDELLVLQAADAQAFKE